MTQFVHTYAMADHLIALAANLAYKHDKSSTLDDGVRDGYHLTKACFDWRTGTEDIEPCMQALRNIAQYTREIKDPALSSLPLAYVTRKIRSPHHTDPGFDQIWQRHGLDLSRPQYFVMNHCHH